MYCIAKRCQALPATPIRGCNVAYMESITSPQAWLGAKIAAALQASPLSQSEIARRIGVQRAAVTGWCRTGRITKSNLQKLASVLGLHVEYFLTPEAEAVAEIADESVSPAESKLIAAFRDLLPEQQEAMLASVKAQADANRTIHDQLARRYGKAIPSPQVAKHIPPAPVRPVKRKQTK